MLGPSALTLLLATTAVQASDNTPADTSRYISAGQVCPEATTPYRATDIARGVTPAMVFEGPVDRPGEDLYLIRPLGNEFIVLRVDVLGSNAPRAVTLNVTARDPVSTVEEFNNLIREACRIEQGSRLRLTQIRLIDARTWRRVQAASARDRETSARRERIAAERGLAQALAAHRRQMRTPPSLAELDSLVRAGSVQNIRFRGQFDRVRDASCRRQNGQFFCRVGVLSTSEQGPEYEQYEMALTRRPDGTIEEAVPDIVVTQAQPVTRRARG